MYRKSVILLSIIMVLGIAMAGCGGAATPETEPPVAEEVAQEVVAPTEVPPTEVPPTEVPPTDIPPTEVPPTEEPTPAWEAPKGALVAVPVGTAPELDGVADDAAWANAPAITVETEEGANNGNAEVTIQAAYDDDMIYFLFQWTDPTESFLRSPWMKNEDGSWTMLSDPDDLGGDNNVYYEDKFAVIWPINDSIEGFSERGCATACHEGEDPKPYGNKYTKAEGMLGDMWHWKSIRNLNQVDDQYLDWTRWSEDTPGAGRKSDPKDSGGYTDNQNEDKTLPAYMGLEGFPTDGSPGYLLESDIVVFDNTIFVPGDMIPSIYKSMFTGDRGDLSAAWKWADGVWILEISRALDTGSEFDVQFTDLTLPYFFGVAVFDNAQVRHSYQDGPSMMVFQPAE
jgi:hypothetical protein